jgi:nicotinate-nucleotide adenylyltransferase
MRLGIFGGTFDPPHLGHQILAMEAANQLTLDRVLWMLTPNPPHKLGQKIAAIETRLELVRAAVEGDPQFELSMLELELPSPQFALNTVREIRKRMPGADIYYLIGEDSLHDLPKWHEPGNFVNAVDALGVMRRPGEPSRLKDLEQSIPGITSKVQFIDAPLLEISSHQIRDRIRQHYAFKYYLPEKVCQMILEKGLYLE